MKAALPLLRFLSDAERSGVKTALVTVTAVVGRSARAIGTHLAVREDGRWCGSVSGGCLEAALVAEAQRIIASGSAELIRFGAGSRYIDIRLPCGGGLDLLFMPQPSMAVVHEACRELEARRPVALRLRAVGGMSIEGNPDLSETGWIGDEFIVHHEPDLRLVIIGHGEEVFALAKLANSFGATVEIQTADRRVAAQCASHGFASRMLKTPTDSGTIVADAYAAVVFLFHDHEWEVDLLRQALREDAFYIGAMGSLETHQARLALLREAGVDEDVAGRIVSPIGFLPASRDPDTLALSALAQIVASQSQTKIAARRQARAA